jgi:hypothetical protein
MKVTFMGSKKFILSVIIYFYQKLGVIKDLKNQANRRKNRSSILAGGPPLLDQTGPKEPARLPV